MSYIVASGNRPFWHINNCSSTAVDDGSKSWESQIRCGIFIAQVEPIHPRVDKEATNIPLFLPLLPSLPPTISFSLLLPFPGFLPSLFPCLPFFLPSFFLSHTPSLSPSLLVSSSFSLPLSPSLNPCLPLSLSFSPPPSLPPFPSLYHTDSVSLSLLQKLATWDPRRHTLVENYVPWIIYILIR